MRELKRKSVVAVILLGLFIPASISFMHLSFFEVRETVALADATAREAADLWSVTQSLLLEARHDAAALKWREAQDAMGCLQDLSLLKGIGILNPDVELTRLELTRLAAAITRKLDGADFSGEPGTGREITLLTQALRQISRVIDDYAEEQSLYFQNLLLFAALLLLSGVFVLVVVEERNRSLLRAEQRARKLSRYLISDYEKSMHSIALDLHDDIAQDLYLVRMEADPTRREELLESSIAKLRRLSYDIRPGKAAALPLAQGLRSLFSETAEKSGWTAHFTETGLKALKLPYEVRIHLYRIMQEALANIRKHAAASSVRVRAVGTYPILKLSVSDDGCGFDPDGEHIERTAGMGLRGIRERIEILGGRLTIRSRPGRGTEIQIEVNIKEYQRGTN